MLSASQMLSCTSERKDLSEGNLKTNNSVKTYYATDSTNSNQSINKNIPTISSTKQVKNYIVKIIAKNPHDNKAYTQGLVYYKGYLYESTGLHNHSTLRKVDIKTGKVLQLIGLEPRYFAEGLTIYKDKFYQLTWETRTGFVYDFPSMKISDTFVYQGEGWGLTHNGEELIMSDGTNVIRFLSTEDYSVRRIIAVQSEGKPVMYLNELEYINGMIWSNVWQSNEIMIIDPYSGNVTGKIDASSLLHALDKSYDIEVLNGIAYDSETGKIYLTGKNWPNVFEVELEEKK